MSQARLFSVEEIPVGPHGVDEWVYFYQDKRGNCKIGTTTQLRKRIARLDVSHRGALLAVVPAGRNYERALHRQFSHLHCYGEWFHLEGELLDLVITLRSAQPKAA